MTTTNLLRTLTLLSLCDAGDPAVCGQCPYREKGCRAALRSSAARAAAEPSTGREEAIARALRTLGVPAHLSGYSYLLCAIGLVMADGSLLRQATTRLYPTVAQAFGATPFCVERAMRHAMDTAWARGDLQVQADWFGNTVDPERGRPVVIHFIAQVADRLKREEEGI